MSSDPPPPPPPPDALTALLQQLIQSQQNLDANVSLLTQTLTTEFHSLRTRLPPPGFQSPTNDLNNQLYRIAAIKLELPRFDGNDALGWIFKINQFFDFHNTPEHQRLRMTSFYMEGEALTWFQWMHANGQLQSWATFVHAVELRFAPSQYDDPKGALFKLCQSGTVGEYQAAFETLANRITGLGPQFLLSCFISGLKPEIRREIQAFQPISLTHAISLAKLYEDKQNDKSSAPKHHALSSNTQNFNRHSLKPTTTSTPLTPVTTTQKTTPIKRLSPAELQARREQGLCYNCDEKFLPGHKCRRTFHLLIAEPDGPEPSPDAIAQLLTEPTPEKPKENTSPAPDTSRQISFHALMGHPVPQTLRLIGLIKNTVVTILNDSGSTHNFIQERVAKQLGLTFVDASAFQVLVGNGDELQCAKMCPNVIVWLGSHSFKVDLYVLPISGVEMVLGVEWLKSLGPVLMDYNNLTMKFMHEGKLIELAATTPPCPEVASLRQLRRLVDTDAVDQYYQCHIIPATTQTETPASVPTEIQSLLAKFHSLFSPPTTLPPSRTINHSITLTKDSDPVNTRPYRYPQFQKQEIEVQIREMLQQGVIQHSSSSFSSPVLLVKKKDSNWHFCIDYRALNAITLKDRFPIPSIDELLDELYGTTCFSKLDLRSRYHQIRMNPDDVHKTAFRTHQGHYEFLVMPFGLCNAPSTFQATMNLIFEPYLRKFVIVFFDDILVYSKSLEEHIMHLETVFSCLLANQFYLKHSKCMFGQSSINYLGHVVSATGVGPDQDKISAMLNWPSPKNIKMLR